MVPMLFSEFLAAGQCSGWCLSGGSATVAPPGGCRGDSEREGALVQQQHLICAPSPIWLLQVISCGLVQDSQSWGMWERLLHCASS